MEDSSKVKLIWTVTGLLIFAALYNAYRSSQPDNGDDKENGDNGDDKENGDNGENPDVLTLTTRVSGPGYIDLTVGDEDMGVVKDNEFQVDYGKHVEATAKPESDARTISSPDTGFSLRHEKTIYASFEQAENGNGGNGNGGEGGHPYNLTSEEWNVCQDNTKELLENHDWCYWRATAPFFVCNQPVVFGFQGGFNDRGLNPADYGNAEEYAEAVADILKEGAPEPIINAHFMGPARLAEIASKEEIMDQIRS